MEFIKVRTKDNQIKYLSARNIITFREVELTSEEAKAEFGENARALVLEITGNGRVEVYGTGDEIGSLISILCKPSKLEKSIETIMDTFLNPPGKTEEASIGIIPNGYHSLLEDLDEKYDEVIDRLSKLEAGKAAA